MTSGTRSNSATRIGAPLLLSLASAIGAQTPLHPAPSPSVDPVLHGNARWSPVSNTAESITGPIETSPGTLRLGGRTIPLSLAHALTGDQLTDAAAIFPITPTPSTTAAIYRVSVPAGTPFKNRNTLCGRQAVTWFVLVNTTADLSLAVFSGASEPDLADTGNSSALCGTFNYTSAPMR